jgi:beta-glucosidase
LKITVDIKNVGKIKGKEVVQVYLHSFPPIKQSDFSLSSANTLPFYLPEHELKDFAVVDLNPNETKQVVFLIPPVLFILFDFIFLFNKKACILSL